MLSHYAKYAAQVICNIKKFTLIDLAFILMCHFGVTS